MTPPAPLLVLLMAGLASCATPARHAATPITTASGLSYTVIEPGEGPVVGWGRRVTIHESTSRTDGTLIFSTWDTGQPITFTLGADQVIDGMEECVSTMRVGERRRATMPPAITRRTRYPESFGPEDTLVFDILLVEVLPE